MFVDYDEPEVEKTYSSYSELNLADVEPCISGPKRYTDCLINSICLNFGDSVTTDHISPCGSIHRDSLAAKYLIECGVNPRDFNSYGSRRGNHEVMMRGTFANIRIVNKLIEGGVGPKTFHVPSGEKLYVFESSMRYMADGQDTIILAGEAYGTGMPKAQSYW